MNLRRARGFSLVEVMVSGGIFLVGMIAVAPLFSFTVNQTARARHITNAQLVALELTERLRAEIHWDAGNLAGGPEVAAEDFWHAEVLPHGLPYASPRFRVRREWDEYTVSYTLTAPNPGADCSGNALPAGTAPAPANSRCALVRVEWPRPDGRTANFELRTLLMEAR